MFDKMNWRLVGVLAVFLYAIVGFCSTVGTSGCGEYHKIEDCGEDLHTLSILPTAEYIGVATLYCGVDQPRHTPMNIRGKPFAWCVTSKELELGCWVQVF